MDKKSVDLARSVVTVLGDCPWEAAAFARGIVARADGQPLPAAARVIYESGTQTLKRSVELLELVEKDGFEALLFPLEITGMVIQGLLKLQDDDFAGRLHPAGIIEDQMVQRKQEECWSSSLLTTFRLVQKRNSVMLGRAERVMMHVSDILFLKAPNTNTLTNTKVIQHN